MNRSRTVILLLFTSLYLCGQQDSTLVSDQGHEKKNSFTSIFYGQPGKAALYSLILPGAGQAYNKRIWKVPIALAIEGAAVYNLVTNINTFQNRDACWKGLLADASDPNQLCTPSLLQINTLENLTNSSDAFTLRQSSRSNKETAWLVMGGVHFLNVIEAFVDRHLINFDTSEDLSYHNLPDIEIVNSSQVRIASVNLLTLRLSLND